MKNNKKEVSIVVPELLGTPLGICSNCVDGSMVARKVVNITAFCPKIKGKVFLKYGKTELDQIVLIAHENPSENPFGSNIFFGYQKKMRTKDLVEHPDDMQRVGLEIYAIHELKMTPDKLARLVLRNAPPD